MIKKIKSFLRPRLPKVALYTYQKVHALPEDLPILISFLFSRTNTPTSFSDRLSLILKCYKISYKVHCPHMENEMIQVMSAIFALDPGVKGVVVEAGSYKGGSTAKLSLAAAIAKRKLFVFDSFEGIPQHKEFHGTNIYGGNANFPPGSYAGSLEEVKDTIKKYGKIDVCIFQKGWFKDTLPLFKESVGAAYVDVDLLSSTETCMEFLYPLLVPKGAIFSQDGHLPWIIEMFKSEKFWKEKLKRAKPEIKDLGRKKLIKIEKT